MSMLIDTCSKPSSAFPFFCSRDFLARQDLTQDDDDEDGKDESTVLIQVAFVMLELLGFDGRRNGCGSLRCHL